MDYNKVHPNFKWNGIALDYHNLLIAAYDLIKEGEEFERITGEFILEWFNLQTYIIVTTSGTTGVQKKIKIEKQAMFFSALATAELFDLKAGNRVLIVANHLSFLDAILLAVFLPKKPMFAVNTFIAGKWWMKPFLALADTYALDPTNPMATKKTIASILMVWYLLMKSLTIPEKAIIITMAIITARIMITRFDEIATAVKIESKENTISSNTI